MCSGCSAGSSSAPKARRAERTRRRRRPGRRSPPSSRRSGRTPTAARPGRGACLLMQTVVSSTWKTLASRERLRARAPALTLVQGPGEPGRTGRGATKADPYCESRWLAAPSGGARAKRGAAGSHRETDAGGPLLLSAAVSELPKRWRRMLAAAPTLRVVLRRRFESYEREGCRAAADRAVAALPPPAARAAQPEPRQSGRSRRDRPRRQRPLGRDTRAASLARVP